MEESKKKQIKKGSPKISVIMSAYNTKKYLPKSIKSILSQTYDDFELIIINDGSTDNSCEIINEYRKSDSRIKIINNNKNMGRAKARNKGLKVAKGEYIAILDSDDIALKYRLEKQLDILKGNDNIFMVGSNAYNINEEGEIISKSNLPQKFSRIKEILAKRNCIYHSSVMYRNNKEYFYREKFPYTQDYDLYLRILSDGRKIINLKKCLIKYRINENSISQTNRGKQALFAKKAKELYRQRIQYGKDYYDEFDPAGILDIDIEKTDNKIILESEIKASFKKGDFNRARKFLIKYFKNYGIDNKLCFFYLISYLPKKTLLFLKKLIKIY